MPPPDWPALDAAVAGTVVQPGSAAYDHIHPAFNSRYRDVRPEAIVSCHGPEDVAETIRFIDRYGLEHATRSGGHCFAGHSSTRGVLIDVAPMRSVSVDGSAARVGAGARLGDVYAALDPHGVTIPGGTCPPVGIAGLTLGGGLGILGRTYGTTSDRLIQAQIVLADGRIVECDEHHDGDLFWALRGAGIGNFGVVTSLLFETVPQPEAVTNLHAQWTLSDAVRVVAAWQRWAPYGPDGLAASLKVTVHGSQPPSVDLYAAYVGTESDALDLLDGLVGHAGAAPVRASSQPLSFPETRRFWADLGVENAPVADEERSQDDHAHLYSKSEFFPSPMPTEAIAALIDLFPRERSDDESRELDFMPWGGAYNRRPADATAFVHRAELFQLKHAATVEPPARPAATRSAERWVARSWATVHPFGSGRVFQNFADPDLEDWATAYYGTNHDRLLEVKARYDPTNFFRFAQALRV